MMELIGTAVVFYFVWRILDAIFVRKPKSAESQFIVQADDGNYYLVKGIEELPAKLPENVVRFRANDK